MQFAACGGTQMPAAGHPKWDTRAQPDRRGMEDVSEPCGERQRTRSPCPRLYDVAGGIRLDDAALRLSAAVGPRMVNTSFPARLECVQKPKIAFKTNVVDMALPRQCPVSPRRSRHVTQHPSLPDALLSRLLRNGLHDDGPLRLTSSDEIRHDRGRALEPGRHGQVPGPQKIRIVELRRVANPRVAQDGDDHVARAKFSRQPHRPRDINGR